MADEAGDAVAAVYNKIFRSTKSQMNLLVALVHLVPKVSKGDSFLAQDAVK